MHEFLKYLPHRPPFLFVDELVEGTEDRVHTRLEARPEEPFFQGHFPGKPIMPGVLICESIFQAGAILMGRRAEAGAGRVPVVTRINQVKLKRAVRPGERMDIEVRLKEIVGPAYILAGKASVAEKTVLTLEFSALMVEDPA